MRGRERGDGHHAKNPSKKERDPFPGVRSCKITHRHDALLFRRGHLHLSDVLGRGGRGLEPLLFAVVGGACTWVKKTKRDVRSYFIKNHPIGVSFTLGYAVVAAQEPTVAHDVPAGAEEWFRESKREGTIIELLTEIFTAK